MRQLDHLIEEGEALIYQMSAFVSDLRLLKATLKDRPETSFVREDGRLSEIGIAYIYAAFDEGKGPSEIARAVGVTVPAIIARRKGWEESKKKARRKTGGASQ